MHVHNMLDWKTQLQTPNEWKQQENMQALFSPCPDAQMRKEMIRYFDFLAK